MEYSSISDFHGRGRHDGLWPADCEPCQLPDGCGGAAGNLYGILPGNIYGLQRQGGSGNFYYRRCGWPDIYFPCRQVGADGIDGTDCSSGIFLYVTGSDYPASYHETFHDRGRAENQDGAASSGFETGEDFIPNHYYDCGVSDSSDYGSSRRYADAG